MPCGIKTRSYKDCRLVNNKAENRAHFEVQQDLQADGSFQCCGVVHCVELLLIIVPCLTEVLISETCLSGVDH